MHDRYIHCYVLGRTDSFDGEVDTDKVVERVLAGAPMRETALEVARRTILASCGATEKVSWLHENLDEVRALGGDTEKAWRMFCQGRIDALACVVEEAAVEGLVERLDEDEGEEEEEEEDGDDEDDEDGEEGEDDEDGEEGEDEDLKVR